MKKHLDSAKIIKNDEFYTRLPDVEKELVNYRSYFEGKVVFCNCDDPEESNFWKYFFLNFKFLKLKKLIATHYEESKPSYKLEMTSAGVVRTALKENGDFRSPECLELLKEADVVVTNPPFSLFREFFNIVLKSDTDILTIASVISVSYKCVFNCIKRNRIHLGEKSPKLFTLPDGSTKSVTTIWLTNIAFDKHEPGVFLYKKYYGNETEYPKYENYNAINVNKTKHIPMDYFGEIGVPLSYLQKHSPKQFEIIGIGRKWSVPIKPNPNLVNLKTGKPTIVSDICLECTEGHKPTLKDTKTGKLLYLPFQRVIIKRK